MFDEDKIEAYLNSQEWIKPRAAQYGYNPFRVLINAAKKAQKYGVIKGILLHQGEADNGDQNWPNNVKIIYDRILEELSLNEKNVPLLAGEVVSAEEGGLFYAHNKIIAELPNVIENSYVISSSGCTSIGDGSHFDTEGYRILGKRYGETMLNYLKEHK